MALSFALTVGLLIATSPLTIHYITGLGPVGFDWRIYVEASHRFFDGSLYAVNDTYGYLYSPLIAPAFRVVEWIGLDAWRFLHVLGALALPTWPLRLIVLVSWPFWYDVGLGNVMTFLLVLAVYALRGHRWAVAGFLGVALLIPKPLLLPVLGWLLWKRPEWRMRFAVMVAGAGVAVLLTGYADEWATRLLTPGHEMGLPNNLAPSSLVGWWWMLLAAPLAVWLTLRGRLGLASVVASPYWLPYYLLMLALEARPASDTGYSSLPRVGRCRKSGRRTTA